MDAPRLTERVLFSAYRGARDTEERIPLEKCICGEHFDCPDDWHWGDDVPCSCTPDCALEPES